MTTRSYCTAPLRLLLSALFLSLLLLPTSARAAIEWIAPHTRIGDAPRLALVIGNGRYSAVSPLPNASNDALAVAQTSATMGFRVALVLDADRAALNAAINEFLGTVEEGAEVLLFYAGHGVELQGANYLLPTDIPRMNTEQERLLRSESISFSELLMDLEARKPRMVLAILDACRDNPFAMPGTRSLGTSRGLGRVDPPSGTFVIFSAGAGQTALDSLGPEDPVRNGVFTRSLLRQMTQQGVELREMMLSLREEVGTVARAAAMHVQTPSYYDQMHGRFYFLPAASPGPAPAEAALCAAILREDLSPQAVLAQDNALAVATCARELAEAPGDTGLQSRLRLAQERQLFQAAHAAGNAALYLAAYPGGRYVGALPGATPTTPDPPHDPRMTARELQTALQAAGCYSGDIDGLWGRQSAAAIAALARHSGTTLDGSEATADLARSVANLRSLQPGRICPLVCDARHDLQGDRCVMKTCPAGSTLTATGSCVTRAARRAPAKAGTSGGSGRGNNCFMFNGGQVCH